MEKRAELLQKILRPSTMIGRRVNLPMRAGGGIGVIRDVQANLCFVDRELADEDEGGEVWNSHDVQPRRARTSTRTLLSRLRLCF